MPTILSKIKLLTYNMNKLETRFNIAEKTLLSFKSELEILKTRIKLCKDKNKYKLPDKTYGVEYYT